MITKTSIFPLFAIALGATAQPALAELPPSEVSMQEAFTADQEAARAIALVSSLYRQLTVIFDGITDEATAAAAAPRIENLQRQLNDIAEHQKSNPDFRAAIQQRLKQDIGLLTELQDAEIRYNLSYKRCLDAGLLKKAGK